jgi:hypothetical protein
MHAVLSAFHVTPRSDDEVALPPPAQQADPGDDQSEDVRMRFVVRFFGVEHVTDGAAANSCQPRACLRSSISFGVARRVLQR